MVLIALVPGHCLPFTVVVLYVACYIHMFRCCPHLIPVSVDNTFTKTSPGNDEPFLHPAFI